MKPNRMVSEADIVHGTPIPTSDPTWHSPDPGEVLDRGHLVEIASHCISIYSTAANIYRNLAKMGETSPVTVFWGGLCEEIEKQRAYWDKVLELLRDGNAKLELLDSSQRSLRQMDYVSSMVSQLLQSINTKDTLADAFIKTHCLQVFLLHPMLLELNEMASAGVFRNVDEFDHAKHLTRFFFGLEEFGSDVVVSDGFKESLERLWGCKNKLIVENKEDNVTGALNRKGLFREMGNLANLAQRNQYTIAILMFHIENAEALYKEGSSEVADHMLSELVISLKAIFRQSDVVGRYDFSTFLVYLSQVKQQFLYEIADRLMDRASLIQKNGLSLSVFLGGSYGSLGGDDARSLQTYIDAAEDCLWRARLSRKNRVLIE